MSQKGFAHLILIIVIIFVLLVLLGGGAFAFTRGLIKIPGQSEPNPSPIVQIPNPSPQSFNESSNSADPTVTLKTEYSNPFDTNTQYSNPFDNTQNPFDSLQ